MMIDDAFGVLDVSQLRPEAVTEETEAFNQMMATALQDAGVSFPPPGVDECRAIVATLVAATSPTGETYVAPNAYVRDIAGPDGPVPVRVFPAENPTGVHLFIHGGGFVIGSADMQDLGLEGLAGATGMTVLSVDYRLAPEHPFPAGLNDCTAVATWLAEGGLAELGATAMTIGGESAGSALALGTLIRLRDTHPGAFSGAVLSSGGYDLTMTPSQVTFDGGAWEIVNTPTLRWFFDLYVPDGVDRTNPEVSQLYAELHDLPPILLTIGTRDPLLDDNLLLFAKLVAAGTDCAIEIAPGGTHGFMAAPIEIGERGRQRMQAFLTNAIAAGSTVPAATA